LYVHCGGEFAAFAGADWQTSDPPGDVGSTTNTNGVMSYTGYLAGWMTQLSQDTAVFVASGTTKTIASHRIAATGRACA
jgi:hypothetical protein